MVLGALLLLGLAGLRADGALRDALNVLTTESGYQAAPASAVGESERAYAAPSPGEATEFTVEELRSVLSSTPEASYVDLGRFTGLGPRAE